MRSCRPVAPTLVASLLLAGLSPPGRAGEAAPAAEAKAGRRPVVELLVGALTDPQPLARHLAARQRLAPEQPPELVAEALGEAIRKADDRLFDPAPRGSAVRPGHGATTTVRREAIQALGKIGAAAAPAIPRLRQIARSAAKDAGSLE